MKRVKDGYKEDLQAEGLWSKEDELAEQRRNDEFGQVLDEIEQYTIDLFGTEKNEYGIDDSILGWLPSEYALDGNRKYIAKQVYNILYQYDMIDNMDDPHFMELVNEMMSLAGLNTVSDSEKIKDSGKARIYKSVWGDSWVVEENEGGRFMYNHFDSYDEAVEYTKKMGFDTQIEDKGLVSDSKKIKDANTPDVLDGHLALSFKEGTEEETYKAIQGHANESGELDGVQYETYEIGEQDGVAIIDMCAATDDPNNFVKALLKEWGVIDNIAGMKFQASEEMKEAAQEEEVSDSCRIKDNVSDTILHFHIGRGGRFYNQGFITYKGEESLSDFVAHNGQNIFIDNDGYYMDGAGNSLGDAKEGDEVGVLDFDGEYDTDYFIYMSEIEIDDRWYDAIMKAIKGGSYVEREVEDYVNSLEY
jgi:hypothetical protein